MKKFNDSRDWFFEDKLGMFIHWGIYSINGWHEQELWRKSLERSEYEKLMHNFNPINYNPDEWLDLAESAGMKYIVFTAKHHDGFCMYDTKYSEYKITNTPYKKDVLAMLADSCKNRGVKLGIYYSLPDWHHPNYPNKGRHHELFSMREGDIIDEEKYLDYVEKQVTELCSNYGDIYEFFWDVNVAEFNAPHINEKIRKLQPNMVINDRGPGKGDFGTPEREVPEAKEFKVPTQACNSVGSQSWGYRKNEDYYTSRFLISSADKILAMGGSYLLNAGPGPDGTIADEYWKVFNDIGLWYKKVKESFEGSYPASFMLGSNENNAFLTRKDNAVYLHIPDSIGKKGMYLNEIFKVPQNIIVLNTGEKLEFEIDTAPYNLKGKPCLHIKNIPLDKIMDETIIIKMSF